MMKALKTTALLIIAATVLSAQVFAQVSPTSTATAGVFTTDVEDSMDVLGYSGVEFEKWAGFVGYGGSVTYNPVSLGYATRFGDLFLGAWYTGNILSTNRSEQEQVETFIDLTNQKELTKITTTTYTNQYTDSNNQIQALIGIGGMGFKVGFYEGLRVYRNPNTDVTITENLDSTTVQYEGELVNYSRIIGSMIPSLEWGMEFAVGDLTISPKISFEFDIYLNKRIQETKGDYILNNGELVGNEVVIYGGNNSGYLAPAFTIGADIGLPAKNENASLSFGLSYGLGLEIYNNSYDVAGFSDKVKGEITGWGGSTITQTRVEYNTVSDNVTLTITDKSGIFNHTITPSLYYDNQIAQNLIIGLYIEAPVSISTSSESDSYQKYFSTTKITYNNAANNFRNTTTNIEGIESPGITETNTIEISPSLNFGAAYSLVPDRFTVNAGFNLNPINYSRTTTRYSRGSTHTTQTTTVLNANGQEISKRVILLGDPTDDSVTDSVETGTDWSPLTVYASAGFRFNFNKNMAIDMAVQGGGSSNSFTLNISNVRAMFTLKF